MSIIQTLTKIDRMATDEKGVVRLNPIDFAKIKKYILDIEFKTQEKPVEIKEELINDTEMKIEDIGNFMKQIVEDVEEGAKEPIRGYIELKRIEKGVKNYLGMISSEAYSDFDNWDKNDLPYGFSGVITNRLYAKYTQDPIYAEKKQELKEREDLLKEAIEQNKKGRTINDTEGNVIECPEYSYKASLVVKKRKNEK